MRAPSGALDRPDKSNVGFPQWGRPGEPHRAGRTRSVNRQSRSCRLFAHEYGSRRKPLVGSGLRTSAHLRATSLPAAVRHARRFDPRCLPIVSRPWICPASGKSTLLRSPPIPRFPIHYLPGQSTADRQITHLIALHHAPEECSRLRHGLTAVRCLIASTVISSSTPVLGGPTLQHNPAVAGRFPELAPKLGMDV